MRVVIRVDLVLDDDDTLIRQYDEGLVTDVEFLVEAITEDKAQEIVVTSIEMH